MSGRMAGSSRYVQNPDGSYRRSAGNVMEEGSAGDALTGEVEVEPEGYDAMTKAELEDELESRGLPKTGNKDELVARLNENDAA
jgi:hypothetical protein